MEYETEFFKTFFWHNLYAKFGLSWCQNILNVFPIFHYFKNNKKSKALPTSLISSSRDKTFGDAQKEKAGRLMRSQVPRGSWAMAVLGGGRGLWKGSWPRHCLERHSTLSKWGGPLTRPSVSVPGDTWPQSTCMPRTLAGD